MYILGIESSCDDTSIALLDSSERGHFVVTEKTASQIEIHKKYGGVVPEIAGRMHAEKIVPLIEEVLKEANQMLSAGHTPLPPSQGGIRPDAIAVTVGPGLITGLLVGATAAKTLSFATGIPLVATNHIDGHIHSVEIQGTINKEQLTNEPNANPPLPRPSGESRAIRFPAIALIVSGGHTELVLLRDHGDYTILGRTKDDAAGECFDKVAKLLGYEYPGGPWISKLGVTGRTDAIAFPRPMLHDKNYDFSFAGLKTSALYWLQSNKLAVIPTEVEEPLRSDRRDSSTPAEASAQNDKRPRTGITVNDFTASFEQAIVDVLVAKTLRAAKEYDVSCVVLGGGVSANRKLRGALETAVTEQGGTFLMALPQYCMDNGAMIAVAGYYQALKKQFTSWKDVTVNPNWRVDQKNVK